MRAAYGNASETSIEIKANITLTNCEEGELSRESSTALTVHGDGHTVHQTCRADTFAQAGDGALTFENVVNVMAAGRDGVDSSGNVTLVGSTISNVGDGDGISNGGTVTVTRSAITGVTDGDGISTGGAVSLAQSHIDGDPNGDCDAISTGGPVTLLDSTLVGCVDGVSNGDDVSVTNSTITGASGDAISTGGTVTLAFATIVNNGEGISGGPLVSFASVVAKSSGDDCSIGTTTSHGFNFDDDGTCGFDQATDKSDAGDPGLGSLAANGGPARTLLPQKGSPLVDQVPAAQCNQAKDERGIARPQGKTCDIGAVEVVQAAPLTTTTTTVPVTVASVPPTTVGPTELPRTGRASSAAALVGLALVAIGGACTLTATSRRRRHPTRP